MTAQDDIFRGYGVEVELKHSDDFLKIKETLTRIGISPKGSKTLYQSAHILHRRGRYVIIHFKELFALDGKPTTLTFLDLMIKGVINEIIRFQIRYSGRIDSPISG